MTRTRGVDERGTGMGDQTETGGPGQARKGDMTEGVRLERESPCVRESKAKTRREVAVSGSRIRAADGKSRMEGQPRQGTQWAPSCRPC